MSAATELALALDPKQIATLLSSAKRLLPWHILPLGQEQVRVKLGTLQLRHAHKVKFVQLSTVVRGAMRTLPKTTLSFASFSFHRFNDMDNTVYLVALYTPTDEYRAWEKDVLESLEKIHVKVGLRTRSGSLLKEHLHTENDSVVVPIGVVVPKSAGCDRVGHLPDASRLKIPTVEQLKPAAIALAGPAAPEIARLVHTCKVDWNRSRSLKTT